MWKSFFRIFFLDLLFACYSVMYSLKITDGFSIRFIVSGGVVMTIIKSLKSIKVGTGGRGICARLMWATCK